MNFFRKFYSDVDFDGKEEVKVLCPFHDDTSPSASINTDKEIFHCWVCTNDETGKSLGLNEEQFVAKLNNISLKEATKVVEQLNINEVTNSDWEYTGKANLWADNTFVSKLEALGFSKETIDKLNLGKVIEYNKDFLGVPVLYNGVLMDVRKYNLFKYPGIPRMLNDGANTGHVIPYDIWVKDNDTTYIVEGEKDMIMAREQGLNAITITGGALKTPNEFVLNAFKDRDVVICYDNDDAGCNGMYNVYKSLKSLVKSIKYINIGEVVTEKGEDFYDYFTKYNGDLIGFLSLELHDFVDREDISKKEITTIKTALEKNILKKQIKSIVIVASEYSDVYAVPTIASAKKIFETKKVTDRWLKGDELKWFLEKNNNNQLLELIEVAATKALVRAKLLEFMGIPSDIDGFQLEQKNFVTIYKSSVIDYNNTEENPKVLDLYTFTKLNVGVPYEISYEVYPHPNKNQKIVAVATSEKTLFDSNNYVINKDLLSRFQSTGSIKERLDKLYQSAKHHIAKHLDYNIWLTTDLVFNSILDFDYGGLMRGALDVFILGDTQVGKSETSSALVRLYEFGHFLSLKTSTTVGLIGGSNKVDGSWCNTIGSIPRQHKRLVVLEEFSGARKDFIKTMTDIRSSNELRIARASGELRVPCKLRMLTISNPLNDDNGNPRFLSTFPNGIIPLMELITAAEDVARYDGFLLTPKKNERFNPFLNNLIGEPIAKEAYEHKAQWVYSRTPDNVKFDEGIEAYIWEKGEELNKVFECNFPLFGTTTAKKLARFCVAMSSLLVNVDESYENILVTKEIVDYTVEYLKSIYDNNVFKLKEYKEEYDSYNNYTKEELNVLQNLYPANATLLGDLAKQSRTTRSAMRALSGLDGDRFNPIFNKLVANKFIRINMETVYPTEKYRRAFPLLDKSITVKADDAMVNIGNAEYNAQLS